jgi:hypothetical protein
VSNRRRVRHPEGASRRTSRVRVQGPESRRSSWGLADSLGCLVAVTMVVWWPWTSSTSPLVVLTILTLGSFACIPWALARWRQGLRPYGLGWVTTGAALGLVVWSGVSMVFSGAPWAVGFYGWENRNDGVLAIVCVAFLMVTAASLRRHEIDRVITWILLGGAGLVVEAMLQLLGWTGFRTSEIDGVWAAMGNPNFLAAMCGILTALALARLLDSRFPVPQRLWAGGLVAGLAATSLLTMSVQGPVTLLIAAVVVLGLRLLHWNDRRRIWVAVMLGLAATIGVTASVLGLIGRGPLSALWASETLAFRQSFWMVSWRIAEALPLLGTGPGGLSRYAGEYRSLQYLTEQGPGVYIDAAHNVPLQYAATTGILGFLLAVTLLASATGLLVLTAWRAQAGTWVVSGVGGAFCVYMAQSMVSIDELRLKELGWILIGLVIALAREASHRSEALPDKASRLDERWLTAVAVGAGTILCVPALWVTAAQSSAQSVEAAEHLATNSLLPCGRRAALVASVAQVRDLEGTWELARKVLEVDPRCPGMGVSFSELATRAGDVEGGLTLAEASTRQDPLSATAWLNLAAAFAAVGDSDSSQRALDRADELHVFCAIPNWDAQRSWAQSP